MYNKVDVSSIDIMHVVAHYLSGLLLWDGWIASKYRLNENKIVLLLTQSKKELCGEINLSVKPHRIIS